MNIIGLILVLVVICNNISSVPGNPEHYNVSWSNVLLAFCLGILFATSLYNDIKNKKSINDKKGDSVNGRN